MKNTSITFFAHATTYDNESSTSTGQADTKISPLGKEQIENLKKLTKNKIFDIVYCSDSSRSIETAKGAFGDRFEIRIDPRLRELDIGEFTGKSDEFVDSKIKDYIYTPFPDGESIQDVKARMASFLDDLRKESNKSRFAVVAHMFNQLALDILLKDMTWEEALTNDWRKTKSWQPGWEYELN